MDKTTTKGFSTGKPISAMDEALAMQTKLLVAIATILVPAILLSI